MSRIVSSGLTESLSWLAQFAGQGFEDVSALANLILLQELMLGEEYMLLAGTSVNIPPPTIVSATLRTAGSNETGIGVNATYYVKVTAVNYYGETIPSAASTTVATTAATVVDVVIGPSSGALGYNIYVSTNNTNWYLAAGTVTRSGVTSAGSQQALHRRRGQVHPPGHRAHRRAGRRPRGRLRYRGEHPHGRHHPDPVRPVGHRRCLPGELAGRLHQPVRRHPPVVQRHLHGARRPVGDRLRQRPAAFQADPAEIVGDGGDIMRLSNDVISQGAATNYRLFLDQPDVSGVRVGAAVSEFQNPITRSILKMVVHPWLLQGTALLMTYQLPQTWTNVANAWEMTCVQDYVSIHQP